MTWGQRPAAPGLRFRSCGLGILLLVPAIAGCEEELKPETLVEDLRVLGVRSVPAEIRPGQTAALEALVVDPRPRSRHTLVWLACDPDPLNLNRSACSDISQLDDPSALVQPVDGGTPELPTGMRLVGFQQQASYRAPDGLFDRFSKDDPRRRLGTVAQVLLLAVADEVNPTRVDEMVALFERVRNGEVKSILSIFRIKVSEDEPPNENPELADLLVADERLPPGATVRADPGAEVKLELTAPDPSFEEYQQPTPDGLEQKTEKLIAAWYSTSGRFSEERIALRSEVPELYTAAGSAKEPLPERRSQTLYVVVRDTRGGQAWTSYPLFLCDRALPLPSASAVEPARATAGSDLTLRGSNLDSVLDVVVGGVALRRLSCSNTECVGELPPLQPGTHAVTLRGKSCADVKTPLSVQLE